MFSALILDPGRCFGSTFPSSFSLLLFGSLLLIESTRRDLKSWRRNRRDRTLYSMTQEQFRSSLWIVDKQAFLSNNGYARMAEPQLLAARQHHRPHHHHYHHHHHLLSGAALPKLEEPCSLSEGAVENRMDESVLGPPGGALPTTVYSSSSSRVLFPDV